MTTEELAELFLVYLYDLAEAAPHPNFLFSVNDFVPRLRSADVADLQKALNSLGDRGLVFMATMDSWGGISAAITMDGSVFVEKGGETGTIARYRENPGAFLAEPGPLPPSSPEPSPEPPPAERRTVAIEEREASLPAGRAIEAIIADMEAMVESDRAIGPEARKDAMADLSFLRLQLARNVKSRQVVEAILLELSALPSLVPLVTGLRCIVEAYLT